MSDMNAGHRAILTEQVMLARLRQSDEMREFFIEMWQQNPALAKQGGARVQALLSPLHASALKQRGISLIELIMFIVIVSVALAGILLVMNTVTRGSADPLIHKQALAIAESLLEEVELMPFTICDPNDVNAASAVIAADCSAGLDQNRGGAALITPTPATENRWSATDPFDNVADYGGFSMLAGICDITNTTPTCTAPIAGLGGYLARVDVFRAGTALGLAGDDLALRIAVTVTGPDGVDVVVEGIRTRYSPRAVP